MAGQEAERTEQQAQLDRIELALQELLEFRDLVVTAAAPLLAGKGKAWLALLAKTRGTG